MSSFERKMKRAHLHKVPTHCGKRMIPKYVDNGRYVWICRVCGRTREVDNKPGKTNE